MTIAHPSQASTIPLAPVPISRPVLRWFGGKWRLGTWIISCMPSHTCFVDVFGGAASILLQKPPSRLEYYNDIDRDLLNFFDVLRERPEELIRAISLTPYHRGELIRALQPCEDPLERARRTYVVCWQNRNGQRSQHTNSWRYERTDTGPNALRGWNDTGRLWDVVERLKQVRFECDDWRCILERYDTPETLFMCDPPYLPESRSSRWARTAYRHELTTDDHIDLAQRLRRVSGMVILCGYPSALYDDLYAGWSKRMRKSQTDGAQKIECLWLNPQAAGEAKE